MVASRPDSTAEAADVEGAAAEARSSGSTRRPSPSGRRSSHTVAIGECDVAALENNAARQPSPAGVGVGSTVGGLVSSLIAVFQDRRTDRSESVGAAECSPHAVASKME